MEQGIRLLIQLVIEFAPVIVSFIQKRMETSVNATNYEIPLTISESDPSLNIVASNFNYEVGLAQGKRLQHQLAVYQHQTLLEITQKERETALKLPEVHKILESWPLRLYPSQILESYSNYGRVPLKIFIAPPQLEYDRFAKKNEVIPEVELMLAEGLRDFITKHYSLHNSVRPTEFLAGAWDSKRFHSESSIKALFSMLKTEPILILESEHDGDYLNCRIAYWGLGQGNYYYKTISRLPYKQILEDSAKSRALEWQKIRDELLLLGEDLEEINNIGRDNVRNLAILEKAEKWQKQGIDINKLSLEYEINHQDFERLCQVLIKCHCLIASWVADIYHLIHHDVPPLLPGLLMNLVDDTLDLQSVATIATGYQQVYQALEQERRYWIPELALQLAVSLSYLSDRSWAKEQVEYSIETWLQLRQVSLPEGKHPLEVMQSALRIEDREYLTKLKEYFTAVDDRQSLLEVEKMLQAIANLNSQPSLESATLLHTLTGHTGDISSIAIAPDGEMLVSGGADKTIKVWNLQKGELIRTLTENLGEISSVAVSCDGNYLAVGSCQHPKSNVKVWHLKTGKLLHTLLGHQKPVKVVVISPDGQLLASGSHKIKIWHLHKGDRICTLWHSSAVDAAAISPDGTILASGSSDSKIRLWNPRTGDPLRTLIGHSGGIKSLAISPDGTMLFSGSVDTTIKIWHLITGKLLDTLAGHSDEVKSIAVSSDGEILWSSSADTTIKMWRLSTGELLYTLTGHSQEVNSIALSANGKFLASGSADRTIKIWQITA
ncbi:WD40 repeat domain-containing protein [Calothrix sp. NIES-2098]|uniref:WD40 repeat domain-containing protein n=1 Tax=Calothrix sp. NIES-2098 TaxID=1954171 RepID=UPI000B6119FA|nr:WD-40 repeat protein [Calothrix sp. NIES-2098]